MNSGMWAFGTEPKYADILLVFASGSSVTTDCMRSFAVLGWKIFPASR